MKVEGFSNSLSIDFKIIIATHETHMHITLTRAPQENSMTGVFRCK